ncbi:MAG TPA: hypothetical protein VH062_10275 [Polyangiaceae bacterium]|nr:hypothetical protein [Polyangiaceae bacterium]
MTLVTVMRDKFRRSWPERKHPLRSDDRAYVLSLGDALERSYTDDAHFAAYRSPNGHRLNCEALKQGVAVEMTAVVFDVDGAGHSATEQWRREVREQVRSLAEVHHHPYFYETRGGCRIVYAQEEPTVIATPEDAKEWSRGYHVAVAYLARCFGIVADPACNDWQRLYRLPRATRDRGAGPENRPIWGNPDRIGDLFIEATVADVAAAKKSATAFRKATPRPNTDAACYRGDGLFYHALRGRGHVANDEAPRGGWPCLCPNRSQHTVNTDWSDTTIVVPPDTGRELGLIVCLHGHCADRFTVKQWLRMFTGAELDAAREAAGIKKRNAA